MIGRFMAVTMESAVFMAKNYQTTVIPLHIPQISHSNKSSTYLQDWCLNKMRSQDWRRLVGRIIHGNTCHQLVTKESSIFNARRSTYFQILYCVVGRSNKRMDLKAWEQRFGWIKSSQNYRDCDGISGEPTEFEWTISQDSPRCSSMVKSQIY